MNWAEIHSTKTAPTIENLCICSQNHAVAQGLTERHCSLAKIHKQNYTPLLAINILLVESPNDSRNCDTAAQEAFHFAQQKLACCSLFLAELCVKNVKHVEYVKYVEFFIHKCDWFFQYGTPRMPKSRGGIDFFLKNLKSVLSYF